MGNLRPLSSAARAVCRPRVSTSWISAVASTPTASSLQPRQPCRFFSQTTRRHDSTDASASIGGQGDSAGRPANPYTAPKGAIVFSGIQPTGVPHLGNYLGAMQRWVQLQEEAAGDPTTKLYYSVVDLHALTSVTASTPSSLLQHRRETLAALLAVGLDPDRCVLFYQSSVPAHSELMWLLSCTASVGYLSRMTQWKSKLDIKDDATIHDGASRAKLKLGLFSYPVLMSADILVHRATHVPVGDDQRQHLEFARECAANFNHTHGQQLLVPPTTLLSPARRVMSLQNAAQKMSKSSPDARSRILLTDDDSAIRKKIMGARTDSVSTVSYDRQARPAVANLLEILVLMENGSAGATGSIEKKTAAVAAELEGASLKALKERTVDAVIGHMGGIRERFFEVLQRDDGAYLDRVAAHGAKLAQANAEETMVAVRTAIGLSSWRG